MFPVIAKGGVALCIVWLHPSSAHTLNLPISFLRQQVVPVLVSYALVSVCPVLGEARAAQYYERKLITDAELRTTHRMPRPTLFAGLLVNQIGMFRARPRWAVSASGWAMAELLLNMQIYTC